LYQAYTRIQAITHAYKLLHTHTSYYTRIQAITHTYILHITGFILKHGSSCIRNNNRNVRLTYSFHSSCSDLD